MTSKIMPNFQEVENILINSDSGLHPSEIHGLMCGAICSNPDAPSVGNELFKEEGLSQEMDGVMTNLYEGTVHQLSNFLFDFNLLLPDDESVLPVRAEGLTLWCQGFLTGLHDAYKTLEASESTDVTEALHDLTEIAKMNFENVVENEEDETAYIELVEYVRMAVILLYQTLHVSESTEIFSDSTKHLH